MGVAPSSSHPFAQVAGSASWSKHLPCCLRSRCLRCLYTPLLLPAPGGGLGVSLSLPVPVQKPTVSAGDTRPRSGGRTSAVSGSTGAAEGSCRAPLRLTAPEPHLVVGGSEGSGKKVSLIPSWPNIQIPRKAGQLG